VSALALDAATIEAIADALAERLARPPAQPAALLSVAEVAARLGRSRDWVRSHRHELGVVAGTGARPRLLFAAEHVAAYGRPYAVPQIPRVTARRRSSPATDALLPYRRST